MGMIEVLSNFLTNEGFSPNLCHADKELAQAQIAYDEWVKTITDGKAQDTAYTVVWSLIKATELRAYRDGMKTGIRLMSEALNK